MDDCSVLIRSVATGQQVTLSTTADSPDELVTIDSITTKRGTGFETANLTLHRNPSERFDDVRLLMDVIITDGEGFVLHEGQITGLPPESGKVKIQSTGLWSILNDRSGFSRVYRDADVSKWGEPPINERARVLAGGFQSNAYNWQVSGGALACEPTGTDKNEATAWYTAPAGVTLSHVDYNGAESLAGVTFGSAVLIFHDGDAYSASESDIVNLTLDSTDRTATCPNTVAEEPRHIGIPLQNSTTGTVTAGSYRKFNSLAVYDDHGLTSITPTTVIQHLIDTYCPGLTYDAESMADHPYEIQQLVFDGVAGSMVVARANSFANWNLEVWEGGKVWYQPSPILTEIDFILDEDSGDVLDPDGRNVTEDYPVNGVEVFYTDVLTGRPERVGPDDDDRLADTSDENPCNREGRNRWGKMELSEVANEDDAIQVGSVWLAEHLIPSRSGSGTAKGTITTASGEEVPCSRIRAGDVVRFKHESIGREVFETNYQPLTGEVTLKFDDGVATLSAILERIGIKVLLLGNK